MHSVVNFPDIYFCTVQKDEQGIAGDIPLACKPVFLGLVPKRVQTTGVTFAHVLYKQSMDTLQSGIQPFK